MPWAILFSLSKLPLHVWRSGPPYMWFLGPTTVNIRSGICLVQLLLQGSWLRQTDNATPSAAIGHNYTVNQKKNVAVYF